MTSHNSNFCKNRNLYSKKTGIAARLLPACRARYLPRIARLILALTPRVFIRVSGL
jgi:hypothetical protein